MADRLERIAIAGDEATASTAKRILMGELNLMDGADELLVPTVTPRRRPRRIPNEDAAIIGRLVGQLGRLTGGIVQLSKSVRESGGSNSNVEAALACIRMAAARVLELHRKVDDEL